MNPLLPQNTVTMASHKDFCSTVNVLCQVASDSLPMNHENHPDFCSLLFGGLFEVGGESQLKVILCLLPRELSTPNHFESLWMFGLVALRTRHLGL